MRKYLNDDINKYKLDNLKDFIKNTIDEILKNSIDEKGLSIEEYEKKKVRKQKLNSCLKRCGVGDLGAKEFVKSYIEDLLTKVYGLSDENIDFAINFNNVASLTTQDKFEIILHHYKKTYEYNALKTLVKKYNLDDLRIYKGKRKFFISNKDIEDIFNKENIELEFQDKLKIISQRIYSTYKGLGVVDEIRDMKVNGLSLGVSGLPEDYLSNSQIDLNSLKSKFEYIPKSYDGIWLYHEGKEIHLSFMSFGSYGELERVCKNSYKFNNPGQFSQSDGFIVNTVADNSRVTVFRTPLSESWVCIIRKFDVEVDLDNFIRGENANKVINLTKLITVKSKQKTIITGEQGAGKTSLLKGLMKETDSFYTIRVSEDFFETHLRGIMPEENIITIQDIQDIPREKALTAFKRSNGNFTVVGEIAEDIDAKYYVKVAQVSEITMACHHAPKFCNLIDSLTDSLMNEKMFNDENIAEKRVVNLIDFNIHLAKTPEGHRYIERITECIPIQDEPYNKDFEKIEDINDKINSFMKTAVQFFEKLTNRKKYKEVNIVEYDVENKRYEFKNRISEERLKEMYKNMFKEDREVLKKFIDELFNEEVA